MPFNLGIQKYFFHDNHTLINSQSASIFIQISIWQSALLILFTYTVITAAMPRWKRHAWYMQVSPPQFDISGILVNYMT